MHSLRFTLMSIHWFWQAWGFEILAAATSGDVETDQERNSCEVEEDERWPAYFELLKAHNYFKVSPWSRSCDAEKWRVTRQSQWRCIDIYILSEIKREKLWFSYRSWLTGRTGGVRQIRTPESGGRGLLQNVHHRTGWGSSPWTEGVSWARGSQASFADWFWPWGAEAQRRIAPSIRRCSIPVIWLYTRLWMVKRPIFLVHTMSETLH